ncbi:MAG: DNA primase [Alphaproteobacteria bacterium]|nr:DNA primase [Alphaproteobacteria bacterium]
MANDDLQRFMDELRARVSIVDVVGAKVKLTKKGREYQGLCPFHNEKTPSFTVNESKGFYHCFGCAAHGDIIKFEMEANGLPFMDALQKLAHQAGLQMPKFSTKDKEQAEERKSLYEIMEQACLFFEKQLKMPEGAEGLKYFMDKRGFSKETIEKFRLGFAPNNNALMAHLKSMGVSETDLKDLGLIAIPEDTSRRAHDFFRNRIMIPITNKQGKIIAFGGRVMEKIEPKYLNSPETPIFNKRRNLYNLDKARESGYKEKKLIICEGYMDVIALDSYGFNYAVAPLGTALTEEQIMEAWKVCPEPILCLDGDAPGTKAAMRSVDRVLPILKAGYSLKFMFLPDNMDPDEYLKAHGKDSFASLMAKTSPLIDILWRKYTEDQDSSTPEKKALIETTLLNEVNKIADATVRSYYAQEIKNRIYLNYKQSAWQKSRQENKSVQENQQPIYVNISNNNQVVRNNTRSSYTPNTKYTKKANSRGIVQHSFTTNPEILRKNANNDADKNLRFIIAGELIYPELIDEYEEQVLSNDIKDLKLKDFIFAMADIYRESETPLNGEELVCLLKEKFPDIINSLWELDMLRKRTPFINDLRENINKLLLEMKLKQLEEEIKSLTNELIINFNEEAYARCNSLKAERDEIIAKATEID